MSDARSPAEITTGERMSFGVAEAFGVVGGCVLLVCFAYAGGRWSAGWAPAVYWLGQSLLLVAVCSLGLSRRASWNARASAILMFAGAQSIISWSYSPDMFRYSDELQHFRSLTTILQTHHLFGVNYSLPVSPDYPGLEGVTAALAQTTRLPPFVCGLIVVGVAHLVLTAALLLLYRRVIGSQRVAAAAALVYTIGTEQAIMRLFVYEAMALPFLVLALYLALPVPPDDRSSAGADGPARSTRLAGLLLGLGCCGLVTVTHHVTAIALAALLAFLCLGLARLRGGRQTSRQILPLSAASTLFIILWIWLVSPETWGYLGGPLYDAAYGLFSGGGAGPGATTGTQGSTVAKLIMYAGPALTSMLIVVGLSMGIARERRSGSPVLRIWIIGSLAYFGVLMVRVFAAGGVELAGRSLAYTSLFSALVVGLAVRQIGDGSLDLSLGSDADAKHRMDNSERRPGSPLWGLAAVAFVVVLGVSGLASAIPPAFERLPGRFHPDGFESGIDQQNVAAARWSTSALNPGHRVFGDFTATTLWGTLGEQDTSFTSPALRQQFLSPRLSPDLKRAVKYLGIQLLVSDSRVADLPPVTGSYFAPGAGSSSRLPARPLPRSAVTKFDQIPDISRIYDNGHVRVYDLRGSTYAP